MIKRKNEDCYFFQKEINEIKGQIPDVSDLLMNYMLVVDFNDKGLQNADRRVAK